MTIAFVLASCVSIVCPSMWVGPWLFVRVVGCWLLIYSFEKRAIIGISKNRPESGGTQVFTLQLVYIGIMHCIGS
jgi:hypothetical protein